MRIVEEEGGKRAKNQKGRGGVGEKNKDNFVRQQRGLTRSFCPAHLELVVLDLHATIMTFHDCVTGERVFDE